MLSRHVSSFGRMIANGCLIAPDERRILPMVDSNLAQLPEFGQCELLAYFFQEDLAGCRNCYQSCRSLRRKHPFVLFRPCPQCQPPARKRAPSQHAKGAAASVVFHRRR